MLEKYLAPLEKLVNFIEIHYGVNRKLTYDNVIDKAIEIMENSLSNQEGSTPYFGWCDVKGCKEEGCSNGNAWRDTGYWTVCTLHADDYIAGKPQPKMKQAAIKKEKSRDKKTGYLP